MADDDGIKRIGPSLYHVRVKRIEKRTGLVANRKATVKGTKADALRVRNEIRAELESTRAQAPKIRLSQYAASWLKQRLDGGKRASTIRRYGYSLERILPALGDIYVASLTPFDVRAYIAKRTQEAEGHTVLNELRCLRTMAKDSVADGYAAANWADRVPAPAVRHYTKQRPNLLTAEQFNELLAKIPRQWLGLVMLMATTGLRWGEASALHWEDISGAEAHVTRTNDRGTLTERTKTGKERTVPVLPEVLALFGLRRRGLVFPSRNKKAHRGFPLIKVLTKACKASGVPRVTAHGLRRTFNNLARQLTSREVLKSITGHVTDAMVEHYSWVAGSEKVLAARAVASSVGFLPRTPPGHPTVSSTVPRGAPRSAKELN